MLIYHQSITRLRAPLVDAGYGNEARNWAAAAELAISAVSVQPLSTTEQVGFRNNVVSGWQVIGSPGNDIDVLSSDRVRLADGTVCEVMGNVARWPGPSQATHHVEFQLQELDGA